MAGFGFFNTATVDSRGSSATDDACDPATSVIRVDKTWVIDGTSYSDGQQPTGYSTALTVNGGGAGSGVAQAGFTPGSTATLDETVTVPAACSNAASGSARCRWTARSWSVPVTNTVTCSPPPPTPLPNTGFGAAPLLGWALTLLAAGLVLVGGSRIRRRRDTRLLG